MTSIRAVRPVGRLLGLGAVLTAAALVAVSAPSRATEANPMDRIRAAAETTNYRGTVTVRWVDRSGPHATQVQVSGGNGVVRLDGAAKGAATPTERWLFRDGDWDLMSPGSLGDVDVPLASKYTWTSVPGPDVAGRPTDLVELAASGKVEERLYVDHATGLLLRREQFDGAGAQIRSVSFDSIAIGAAPPLAPGASVDRRPKPGAATTRAPYVAPAVLPGGYQRVGVYRRGKTLQVVYSDGMHGLSMFEQPGKLDTRGIPSGGQQVAVGPGGGVSFVYAGGQVVMWQAGPSAYTVVGDGAPDDVLLAARGVPVPEAPAMTPLARLRRACREVVRAVTAA
jgi:sigma-E factor negative regulatory protein RseB